MTPDEMINELLSLQELHDKVSGRIDELKDQLRALGPGTHGTTVPVMIKPPARRFDPNRAVAILGDEVVQACMITKLDEKALKGCLTSDQLDLCMSDGTGQARVVFR